MANELLEIEKEKLSLKRRKVEVMEQILLTMQTNTVAIGEIRDFLYEHKSSMFMPISICDSEH